MQEREPGFSPDAQDDIIETARIYLVGNEIEKELLQTDYPQHYKLIKQLLK
jgi:hypothetical protein